ncbi:MAG: Rieske 2Fe-2S domain-containing protein [Sulfurovum sp.]|nr:Rieske 2Fe-2S domain-containing protein [Sulfurovum sp.]
MEKKRRDFMGLSLGLFTAAGGVGALYAMKRTWDPLPSVQAAGFSTIDLALAKPNELLVEKWRGKPIFILKKTPEMETHKRDIIVGGERYHVSIGLCTHLGCIPAYKKDTKTFFCACHGGVFDISGIQTPGLPPPSPLEIPPFKIEGTTLVLGEEGPEYLQMKTDGLTV